MAISEDCADYVKRKLTDMSSSLESGETKANLAKLRRGIGKAPGEIPELLGFLLLSIPPQLESKNGEPSNAEWAIYIALTTYALNQQENSESMYREGEEYTLGRSVGRMIENPDDAENIIRRFNVLVSSHDMVGFSYHLRNIVQMMRTKDIPLDYGQLAADLYRFQWDDSRNKVCLKWAQDFYRVISNHSTNGKENKDD